MVACTDETVWFIRKEVIQEMTTRNVDFSNNKMGWGWDIVLASICFVNGRPVIRDYNHTIDHPPGTNYNKDVAGKEMQEVWRTLDDELKTAFALIKGSKYDREKLAEYFQ